MFRFPPWYISRLHPLGVATLPQAIGRRKLRGGGLETRGRKLAPRSRAHASQPQQEDDRRVVCRERSTDHHPTRNERERQGRQEGGFKPSFKRVPSTRRWSVDYAWDSSPPTRLSKEIAHHTRNHRDRVLHFVDVPWVDEGVVGHSELTARRQEVLNILNLAAMETSQGG